MEKQILAPGIVQYENVVDNPMGFIDVLNNGSLWEPGIAAPSRYLKKDGHEMERLVEVFFLPTREEIQNQEMLFWRNRFVDAIEECEKDYLDYYVVDTVFYEREWLQFLKYEKGHHFANHIDDVPDSRRTLSGVYYFNDDYCDGQLYFKHFDLTIKPRPNTYLLFPSNWTYAHSAKKVTCGTKYAMVNFLL